MVDEIFPMVKARLRRKRQNNIMPFDVHEENKTLLTPLRKAQADFDAQKVRTALKGICSADLVVRMCFPFNDITGSADFYASCYEPLLRAFPNLERRDWIVISGSDGNGKDWVGCGGHYVGTFVNPFLDIPPTGHLAHMRFHEFYRFENGKVVEVQAIWDIPELMLQSGVWPMIPSLGREFCVPGPATCDGLQSGERDESLSNASLDHVIAMLTDLKHVPDGPEEAMNMPHYWHEKMNWYGPAGTGTARGHRGFRNWHQIPFITGMPDRGKYPDKTEFHFFAENAYVGVTGWPDMHQTLSHGGWYGIPPLGKKVDMRSLDFWRLEVCDDGIQRIRENWVLWDMLDVYNQIGVDVFARMKELSRPYERIVPDEVWKQK
jgi:predicted ester cyclase